MTKGAKMSIAASSQPKFKRGLSIPTDQASYAYAKGVSTTVPTRPAQKFAFKKVVRSIASPIAISDCATIKRVLVQQVCALSLTEHSTPQLLRLLGSYTSQLGVGLIGDFVRRVWRFGAASLFCAQAKPFRSLALDGGSVDLHHLPRISQAGDTQECCGRHLPAKVLGHGAPGR